MEAGRRTAQARAEERRAMAVAHEMEKQNGKRCFPFC